MSSTPPLTITRFVPISDASRPRSVVVINGLPYLPVRWQTNKNGHGATDDATVTLPIKGNPDFSRMLAQSGSGAFTPVPATIYAGYPNNPTPSSFDVSGMTVRFQGNADLYEAQADGDEVTFTIRSLAAPLVDNKLTSAPISMTAVQFAQTFATALGLKINVLLAPGVKPITIQEALGREFVGGPSFNSVVFNMHPWDVLLQCALFDDADVWVDNDTLNYASPALIPRNTINLPYGSLLKDPKLSHSLLFNKNIRVEVRTWTARTKTATVSRADGDAESGITLTQTSKTITSSPIFGTPSSVSVSTGPTGTSTTTSTASGGGYNTSTGLGSEPNKLIYKFYRENLTQAKANDLAKSLWRQYSAQEYSIEFSTPMTKSLLPGLSITSLFRIHGLPYAKFNRNGTATDGYYPRKLTETFDPKGEGWQIGVTACSLVLPSGAV